MAIFSKKEFAAQCGIDTNALSVHIRRKKVLPGDDGSFDTSKEINASFLKKMKALHPDADGIVPTPGKPGRKPKGYVKPDVAPQKKQPMRPREATNVMAPQVATPAAGALPVPDPNIDRKNDKILEMFSLDKEVKAATIKKNQADYELQTAKIKKMRGELVETRLVKTLFTHVFREFTMSFKQESEKMIIEFAQRSKMNINQVAEFRGMLVRMINDAVNHAVDNSKRGLSGIVEQQTEKAA